MSARAGQRFGGWPGCGIVGHPQRVVAPFLQLRTTPVLVGSGLKTCSEDESSSGAPLWPGRLVTSMNPLSPEGTTMVPTSPFHHLRSLARRARRGGTASPATHPEAEVPLHLPRRIDGPAAAAQLAGDLLRHHRGEITLALYLDDRHRLVGTAIVAVGWVQAARLSARPVLAGAMACRATSCILVRHRRWGAPSATEPEDRTFPYHRCCVQPVRARGGRSPGGGRRRHLQLGDHRLRGGSLSLSTTCWASDATSDAWAPPLSTCLAWTDRASAPWCRWLSCSPGLG